MKGIDNTEVKMDVNKQPKSLPLEELQVPVSRLNDTLRPALHLSWAEHRILVEYKPLQLPLTDGTYPLGVKEEWVNRVDAMLIELQWLLGLPHHRFWSQIAYKIGHIDMVNSFLKAAPPFYIANLYRQDEVIWEHYIALFKIMFSVLKRLGTHSESRTEFIGIKFYGNLLYDLCIFTIPSLLDICLLYSQHYRGDVINIVTTVITVQPKYLDDLISDLPFISITFKYVTWKFDESADSIHSLEFSPHLLMLKLNPIDLQLFRIVLKNVIHTTATLNYFMDMYPPVCQILYNEKFHFVLLSFYEITIPKMYKKLEKCVNKVDDECIYVNLKYKLHTTRVVLLCSFKHILGTYFNQCVDFNSLQTELEHKKCINDYMTMLIECFLFKLFMRDYINYYPIDVDLCVLVQIYPDLKTKQSELTNLVNSSLNALKPKLSMSYDKTVPGLPVEKIQFLDHRKIMSPSPLKTCRSSDGNKTSLPSVFGCSTTKGSADIVHVSSVQLDSLIEEVHSVFLNLEKGFIKRCLEVYNYSSECVIYSIYECSLPSSLVDLTRDQPLTEYSMNNVEIDMVDKEKFRMPENLTSLLRKHHLKELRDTFMINALSDELVE